MTENIGPELRETSLMVAYTWSVRGNIGHELHVMELCGRESTLTLSLVCISLAIRPSTPDTWAQKSASRRATMLAWRWVGVSTEAVGVIKVSGAVGTVPHTRFSSPGPTRAAAVPGGHAMVSGLSSGGASRGAKPLPSTSLRRPPRARPVKQYARRLHATPQAMRHTMRKEGRVERFWAGAMGYRSQGGERVLEGAQSRHTGRLRHDSMHRR